MRVSSLAAADMQLRLPHQTKKEDEREQSKQTKEVATQEVQ